MRKSCSPARFRVVEALRIGVEPEPVEHVREDVLGRVEDLDAAILELRDHLPAQHQVPGVEGLVAEALADLLHVEADAGRAPHVVDAVLVAGVVDLEALHHLGPHVLEVRQLRLVELREHAGLDQPLQERPRGHDDVVAGLAGKQLRLDDLVVVVGVVGDLDAGLLGEALEHLRVDVVGPVIDVDDALLRERRRRRRGSRRRRGPRGRRAASGASPSCLLRRKLGIPAGRDNPGRAGGRRLNGEASPPCRALCASISSLASARILRRSLALILCRRAMLNQAPS